jgi:hypothetical protein
MQRSHGCEELPPAKKLSSPSSRMTNGNTARTRGPTDAPANSTGKTVLCITLVTFEVTMLLGFAHPRGRRSISAGCSLPARPASNYRAS